MNVVKEIQRINLKEASLNISADASWHHKYKDSPYIYIGGLLFDLTEGDIIQMFSQYGEIADCNLIRDKVTGKPKGFAFLAYEDQRSTILAVDNFNGVKLLGRTLRVDHCAKYRKPKEDEDQKSGESDTDQWDHDKYDEGKKRKAGGEDGESEKKKEKREKKNHDPNETPDEMRRREEAEQKRKEEKIQKKLKKQLKANERLQREEGLVQESQAENNNNNIYHKRGAREGHNDKVEEEIDAIENIGRDRENTRDSRNIERTSDDRQDMRDYKDERESGRGGERDRDRGIERERDRRGDRNDRRDDRERDRRDDRDRRIGIRKGDRDREKR